MANVDFNRLYGFVEQNFVVVCGAAIFILICILLWLSSVKPRAGFGRSGSSSSSDVVDTKYLKNKVQLLMKRLEIAPFEYFVPSQRVLGLLKNNCCDEVSIEKLIREIFKHLNIPFENTTVVVEFDEKYSRFSEEDMGPAGQFVTLGNGNKEIHVVIKPSYSLKEVIVITCHECTHAFLYYRDIKITPTSENEMLTDTAAVYVGFGKHLLEGYKPISQVVGTDMTATSKITRMKTASIGYIKMPQLRYVVKEVTRLRNEFGARGSLPSRVLKKINL